MFGELISEAHGSGRFISEINANAEEISRAGGFTTLATNAILGARG